MKVTTQTLKSALMTIEDRATTLVASPRDFWFGVVQGGVLVDASQTEIQDVDNVFEVRAFDGQTEWRWLKGGGSGAADPSMGRFVEVSDEAMLKEGFMLATEPVQYLLWGAQHQSGRPEWCRLSEDRIGSLDVPFPDSSDAEQRLAVEAVEYLAEDAHGNIRVADQRLCGFRWQEPQGGNVT